MWPASQFAAALAAGCAVSFGAAAQSWPTKAVHLVSPYAPGGSTDIVARLVAPRMSASVGQPVVVDNRAGAGGTIGAEVVAHSAPDGYTLLMTSSALLSQMAFANRNLPYDPVRDFTPITAAVTQPGILLVSTSLPIRSFTELASYARSNPGKLSYATTGVGSSFHFMGEIVKQAAGIDLVHVPYKGGAQASQAIASGEVQVAFISNVSGMAAVRAGKARPVAILADKRAAELPDVPAIAESLPGVDRPADWLGFYGPAPMASPLLARVHAELVKALNDPGVVKSLHTAGMEVFGNSPEEFAALIKRDVALYRKMAPIAGIKLE